MIDSSPKPVVALINGEAFGGGLELALGCQYRSVNEGKKKLFFIFLITYVIILSVLVICKFIDLIRTGVPV